MLAKIRAFRATKEVISRTLKVFDVTIMQWLFLGVVAQSGGKTTAMEIAKQLNVSMPLVTRFTQQLLAKELITVTRDNEDKRTKFIELTKAGQGILIESEPEVRKALKLWLESIPPEDVSTYITVLLHVAYKL